MHKNLTMFAVLLSLVLIFGAQPTFAASTATIYVVHGIDGRDLGLAKELPVDIKVNGACALKNVTFGTITGAIKLPTGMYSIAVSLADGGAGCTNPKVVGLNNVKLTSSTNATIVADNSPSGLRLSVFKNDLSRPFLNGSRVVVRHTANAPAVDIMARRTGSRVVMGTIVKKLTDGKQRSRELIPGKWDIAVIPSGTTTPVFGPVTLSLRSRTVYFAYAVGSPANGTFTVLTQAIPSR